jgi:hypothetical protein
MPLVWKLDPENSLVVAVANGDVTRLEVEGYLDALIEKEALPYRKVFDVHHGDTSMTADDVLPLAVRMRTLHDLGPMGPLVVILPAGRGKRLQRALGMVATAKRPMRVFEDQLPAYRWVAKQRISGVPNELDAAEDTLEWSAKARNLAAHIKRLARTADAEAQKVRPTSQDEEVVYRGQADLLHRGVPLNICVKKVGPSWEFLCCRADRLTLGSLLTLQAEEIVASLAQGQNPLKQTLDRIKGLVRDGSLAIPNVPSGSY